MSADRGWLIWPAVSVVLAASVGYALLVAYVIGLTWWTAGAIIPLGFGMGFGLGAFAERIR